MFKKQTLSLSLLVTVLLGLSSCNYGDQEKKKEPVSEPAAPKGEVLLTIDGKPKITVNDFEQYKKQFFTIQPQYQQILQFMPKTEQIRIDQNIFQNMINEVFFQEWVGKNQIDKRKDYQDDLNMIIDMGKRNLAIKYYQEKNPIKLTEAEIKKFYEDNKDKMPELTESPGGVHAKAVKFENEMDAKNFLEKVKNADGKLEKVAKDAGHKVEELKQINQMSFHIDSSVRQKLLELKKFPTHLHVKAGDKSHYVLHATHKDKPKYVPFEQVKAGLENFLKQQKMGDMLTKGAEKLKKKYNGVENTEYFTQQMIKAEKEEKKKQEKRKKDTKEEKKPGDMPLHEKPPSSVKGA